MYCRSRAAASKALLNMENNRESLTIVSARDDAKDVFVEVQDTCPRLGPEKLDRFFQSFYTAKREGIGMGFAISRSIAEAHGGAALGSAEPAPRRCRSRRAPSRHRGRRRCAPSG